MRISADPELLRRVLHISIECWNQQVPRLPAEEREICYEWVRDRYRARFGVALTRPQFESLFRAGLIEKGESSRAGKRRYYRLRDVTEINRR